MVDGWVLGLAANATIAVAYGAIAVLLAVNISRTKQWMANPLAAATFFLYATCGGGHAVYALQLADLALGFDTAAGSAARSMYGGAEMWAWDVVTAAVGIWYWTMRKRFPDLVTGTAVFEDLRQRQKRALEINDNIVQGIVQAKLNMDLHQDAEGRRVVADTIAASRRLADDLQEGSHAA